MDKSINTTTVPESLVASVIGCLSFSAIFEDCAECEKVTPFVDTFKCFYCGCDLNKHTWNLDHYTPKSKGGKNNFDNLRPSCKKCNTSKSDMPYEQFIKHVIKLRVVHE